ncbi:diadenylate cyclase [Mycobacterium colombiense]|uniref:diadenylate cyclase n=1 Tax=Mycobacterium colombiense TaxID=339268 RepID=UPI000949FB68|nr:diadenylate cyclase [Mycobacterium colombiense]
MNAGLDTDANQLLQNRVQRLRSELDHEKVPITNPETLPASLRADSDLVLDVLCEEIVHARYVEVHEGHRPSYGCFIIPDLEAIGSGAGFALAALRTSEGENPTVGPDLDLRLLVDGEQTFLLRDVHGRVAMGTIESPSDELSLIQMCRNLSGVCVQRQRSGRIQLLMEGIVCINDDYDWRWLITARRSLPSILTSLNPPGDLLERVSVHLGEILDLCVHLLSPRGIGATLVWQIGSHGPIGSVSNQPSKLPAVLNVFRRQDRFAIVSLLASVDGACFISSEGDILNYWAMLDPSSAAKDLVAEQGGTRHTSAKRYSFDEPRSLVVVVSTDGPVTVFSDGARLARLADPALDRGRDWMTRLNLADGFEISTGDEQLECFNCGKQLHIEVDTHPDADRSETVECPVCMAEGLRNYERVIRLHVRVAKEWGPH